MSKIMSATAEVPAWDPSKGPDFCSLITYDPDVRTKKDGVSPGRSIGVQKKNAGRNTVDYHSPLTGCIYRAEGTLEMKGLHQFFRDPRVTNVEPQYGPLSFIDQKGKRRDTFVDARMTYDDHTAIVVSFKPAEVAARTGHKEELQCIVEQLPPSICQGAQLITDRDLPEFAVINGRLIFSVLNDHFWLLLAEMSEGARALVGAKTIGEFCHPHGGVATTFRTAVKLIAMNLLYADPGEIKASTIVRNRALEVGDAAR